MRTYRDPKLESLAESLGQADCIDGERYPLTNTEAVVQLAEHLASRFPRSPGLIWNVFEWGDAITEERHQLCAAVDRWRAADPDSQLLLLLDQQLQAITEDCAKRERSVSPDLLLQRARENRNTRRFRPTRGSQAQELWERNRRERAYFDLKDEEYESLGKWILCAEFARLLEWTREWLEWGDLRLALPIGLSVQDGCIPYSKSLLFLAEKEKASGEAYVWELSREDAGKCKWSGDWFDYVSISSGIEMSWHVVVVGGSEDWNAVTERLAAALGLLESLDQVAMKIPRYSFWFDAKENRLSLVPLAWDERARVMVLLPLVQRTYFGSTKPDFAILLTPVGSFRFTPSWNPRTRRLWCVEGIRQVLGRKIAPLPPWDDLVDQFLLFVLSGEERR